MLRRNPTWGLAVLAVVAVGVVVVVLVAGGSSGKPNRKTVTTTTTSEAPSPGPTPEPQPAPPAGWVVHDVANVRFAVPAGWRSAPAAVSGATISAWWPGPPASGVYPTRCAVQERPQWLIGTAGPSLDWWAALRSDLAEMKAVTASTAGRPVVTGVRRLRVAGAADALAFDAVVTRTGSSLAAQTSDLLVALHDGTEIHVTCSGPPGHLPSSVRRGVDSTTVTATTTTTTTTTSGTATTGTTTTTSGTGTGTQSTTTTSSGGVSTSATTTGSSTTATSATTTGSSTTATTATTTHTQTTTSRSTRTTATTHTKTRSTTSTHTHSTSISACAGGCEVTGDGLVYRITSIKRYKDIIGSPALAIGYSIANTTSSQRSFTPFGSDFEAITAGGGDIGVGQYEGGASGDPLCYDNSQIDPGATGGDPQTYHLKPGKTLTLPEMCFVLEGQTVTAIQFFDEQSGQGFTVRLRKPI